MLSTDKINNNFKYRKGNLLAVFLDPLEIYKYTFILHFHGYAKKSLRRLIMDVSVGHVFKGISIKSIKGDDIGGIYINYAYKSKPEVTGFIHFTKNDIKNCPYLQVIFVWVYNGWDSLVKFVNEMNDDKEKIWK